MKMKSVVLMGLGVAAALTASAQQVKFTEFDLSNGLHVILHQDKSAPVVAVSVMYHVGSKDEDTSRTGFAHFFEHLLFEGSQNIKRGEFMKLAVLPQGAPRARRKAHRGRAGRGALVGAGGRSSCAAIPPARSRCCGSATGCWRETAPSASGSRRRCPTPPLLPRGPARRARGRGGSRLVRRQVPRRGHGEADRRAGLQEAEQGRLSRERDRQGRLARHQVPPRLHDGCCSITAAGWRATDDARGLRGRRAAVLPRLRVGRALGPLRRLKDWYAKIKSRPAFRSLLADQVPGFRPAAHYADLDF